MVDYNNMVPMLHRRRLLQLVASSTALSSATGVASAATDDGFLDVLSSDPSGYPTVRLNVQVDTDAGRDGELTQDDFTIYEDGEIRPLSGFEFASTSLDLVFVFDDSGSMGDEIAAMKRETKDLTDKIASSGIDAQYGLVSFRDEAETDLTLTSDAGQLKNTVDNLTASGGGDFPEDNLDSIDAALDLEFRDSAQKIIVDITDATSHYDGDGSGYGENTIDQVATRLRSSGVAFIAVSPGYDDPDASMKVLANKAGGNWIDIGSADFDVILEGIAEILVETYILEYETTALPGEKPGFSVEATDPERGTDKTTGEVTVPEDAGPTVPPEFRNLKSAKLDLATHLDDISQSLNEEPLVRDTLEDLETRIKNGEASPEQAISAVERMLLGENITEISLAGIAPVSVSTPEDGSSRIGEPNGSPAANGNFDLAGSLVENVLQLLVGLLLGIAGFKSVAGWLAKFSSRLDDAIEFLDNAIATLFGAIPFIDERIEDIAKALTEDSKDQVENGETDGDDLYETVAGAVQDFRDPLANSFVANVEGGFQDQLQEFDDALGLDDDGEFGYEGDNSDAQAAAESARSDVVETLEEVQEELEITGFVSKVGDIMAIGGALLSLSSGGILAPVGAALSVVGAFFSLGFGFLGSVAAADGVFDVRAVHNDGLDSIVQGGI